MSAVRQIVPTGRRYNQWVANETLEDFALRYTARRARKWSDLRIANTALGIVSFLALEAIGGAITLQYGFTNAAWAIVVVCALIFLFGLPVCYHAAREGLDIDLLTRGAGFGYIGSTISSLIYASFTFIFFALEAAIMSMALQLLFDMPLGLAYVISALAVIPLVTHGITRISRFQLWTQPVWLVLQIAPLAFIVWHNADEVNAWLAFPGVNKEAGTRYDLLLFGAAAGVIFPLIAQNGEQVDYLRFLPREDKPSRKWWAALVLAGPGWTLFGVVKLFAGSFLAVLALRHDIAPALADDPAHMYLMAFGYITPPEIALWLSAGFVILSQLKINVTNAYAGSIAWSNFFARVTHNHPGRIVWLFFNVAIALLLMELGLYQAFEHILITYSVLVLAWFGTLTADLVINRGLGLRPREIDFRRSHLYDINPVGVGSMLIASALGFCGQLGLLGKTLGALSPFIALFIPFVVAPLLAHITRGRYYRTREEAPRSFEARDCLLCGNRFEGEDTTDCPAYEATVCSLCCALDSCCGDRCRPRAHIGAQARTLLLRLLPRRYVRRIHSSVGYFLLLLGIVGGLMAALFGLVSYTFEYHDSQASALLNDALFKTYFLLMTVTGVLLWLYVLAQDSRSKALRQTQARSAQLSREVAAHQNTARALQAAKEAAINANQAKSRYLSGVSHELRTPLNTMLGYAQLMENDSALDQRNRHVANVIRRNGEHLSDLIEGLLEISKIEARRLDLHRNPVKLRALVEQLAEIFTVQARARGLTFRCELDRNLPDLVATDEKRLRQILTNLLSNAIKFTRQGEVVFEVSMRSEVARFVVSDTGIGIDPNDQERIFQPFERVRTRETQHISGTGLGLAISRLLCNLMGGDLSLQSIPGKGSTFTVSMLLPAISTPREAPVEHRRILGYRGRPRTLLVVDDEPMHRSLIVDMLTPLGFSVLEAHDADTALRVSRDYPIDLYLLDVHMPETNGWELARALRQAGQEAPILMLSADAIEDHREYISSPLHAGYLVKPIRLEPLLEHIGKALRLHWQYQDASPEVEAADADTATCSAPGAEVLAEIAELAAIGYLKGVQEKLEALRDAHGGHPLLCRLYTLADRCDLDALRRAIEETRP